MLYIFFIIAKIILVIFILSFFMTVYVLIASHKMHVTNEEYEKNRKK